MLKNLIIVLATIVACSQAPAFAQSKPPADKPVVQDRSDLSSQQRNTIAAINNFGWKVFRVVYDSTKINDNIFMSPLSVSYALGIVLNGASGSTRDSIQAALGLTGLSISEIDSTYRELATMFATLDSASTFSLANSVWHRKEKKLVPEFVEICRDYFNAPVEPVNFGLTSTIKKINTWASDNTNGKIRNMISDPVPSEIASIVLNAVYFKAPWSLEFEVAQSRPLPFHIADGSATSVEFMCRDGRTDDQHFAELTRKYPIGQFDDSAMTGANLPYGMQGRVMTLIVPDSTITLDSLVNSINPDKIVNWGKIDSAPGCGGYFIALPKLRFSWEKDLSAVLAQIGLASAFKSSADFSGMFEDEIGWISQISHKAFVQIDEHGTEAAAATTVWKADCIEPQVICDHPFLFVIQDRSSGIILFIGKIGNPVWTDQ